MATEIKIPIPDQTTQEVRVVKWRKTTGDAVQAGEVVLEVETDKSVIEVESLGAGVILNRLYEEGAMVPVGQVVGYVGQAGEAVQAPQAAVTAKAASAAAEKPKTESAAAVPAGVAEVKIPIPDQTTQEVRIVKWRKREGETVSAGEVVLEVETDKSVIEVESSGAGVLLKQLVPEGGMTPVGTVIGYVGPAGTSIAAGEAPKAATKTAAAVIAPVASVVESDTRIKASPLARKTAERMNVNLASVPGTGPMGRILKNDVQQYAIAGAGKTTPPRSSGRVFSSPNARRLARELGVSIHDIAGTGPNGRVRGADVKTYAASGFRKAAPAAAPPTLVPAEGQPQPGTEVEVTKMRRAIGKNLQMSFRDTPHFNVTMAINMSRAIAFRTQYNLDRPKEKKISVNDLVLRACAVALRQYPTVNSRFTEEKITFLPDVNIGIATALPTGLVVPVLTNADKRDWDDLAAEAKRLAAEARNGKIIGAGKGTFTVSNLGMFGVDEFTAIINPPESAILAVGAVQDQVVAINGMIGIQPMMKATLCSDHRVVDGALAAQFLLAMKKYLEEQIGG